MVSSRRHLFGVADQGVSSLTNLVLVSMMLRSLPTEAAGEFSLFYGLTLLVLSAFRAYFGNRIVVQGHSETAAVHISQGAHFAAVFITVILTLPLGVAYLLGASGRNFELVLAMVAFAVLLVWQDLLRFTGMALNRQVAVLLSDLGWLFVVVVGWVIAEPLPSLLALVLGPGLGLVVLLLALKVYPNLASAWELTRNRHRASERRTLGSIASLATTYATLVVATLLGGPSMAAGLQAGLTVSSPPSLLSGYSLMGLTTWQKRKPRESDVVAALALAGIGAVVTCVWAAFLVVWPQVIVVMTGESAELLKGLLWIFLAMRLATLISTGADLALRVREQGSLLPSLAGALAVAVALAAAFVVQNNTLAFFAAVLFTHAFVIAAVAWALLIPRRKL